jgi:hypothetical protein
VERRALLLAAGLLAACDEAPRIPAEGGTPAAPSFDAAWRISTHNSYWVDHGASGDLFASGTQERIADQLLFDHARGVEIDIHKDPTTPGAFAVYHTTPGNGLCDTLPGCLAALRAFHRALPQHEALHVTLELKEITAPLFDASHTIADLDRVLASELGDLLYRPADLLTRCPDARTLSECARDAGWPTTHELRGRVIVSVLGNWTGLPGAQATKDYLDYATTGDIAERSAFPMASSWQLDHEALTGLIYNLVTQDEIDRAFAQAVFLQVEDTADPHIAPFLARHGVVRVDGAASVADQQARIALGLQLLQGDSPWIQADDHGPAQPYRALAPGFDTYAMTEPGSRLSLSASPFGERVFAYVREDAPTDVAWETTASSGSDATRVGCLRAATTLGSEEGSVMVCRAKIAATPGMSSMDAERAIVRVTVCKDGACTTEEHPSEEPAAEGPGDLLRLEVSHPVDGAACVRVRSAAAVDVDSTPRWADLGGLVCIPGGLPYVGIATPASAWFFGTRREAAGQMTEPRGADFTGVISEGGAAPHDATALLRDASSP